MAITLMLAENHQVVRQGLRALLELEPDFRVLAEASDGLEAVDLAERLQPEVLVLDLMMPGLGGIDVVRQVLKRSPRTRILMLSMYDDDVYVSQSLKAGATGYALKDCSAAELVDAVHAAAAGFRYLSPALAGRSFHQEMEQGAAATSDPYDNLTNREREVLHLVVDGLTSAQIAERLFISPRTAEAHRANLARKLGITSQTELIRWAIKRGIRT